MELPEINKRIKQIVDYETDSNVTKFAESINLPQQTVNRLFVIDKRTNKYPVATTDTLQRISEMYDYLSSEWLLTGRGNMLKANNNIPVGIKSESLSGGIPLIPLDAMAGYCKGEFSVMDYECEKYVIPAFREAEFLIPVKGSSMYPKYSSGDIVACKRVPLKDIFFQWNKVYVVDTNQGPLIKRIKKGKDDDHILLVSENERYDPFELSLEHINAVAIVIGVIRLE